MEGDYSLSDLKTKKIIIFLKEQFSIKFEIFYSKFHCETRTSIFSVFRLLETPNWCIL